MWWVEEWVREVPITAATLPPTADQAASPHCVFRLGNGDVGPLSAPSSFPVAPCR